MTVTQNASAIAFGPIDQFEFQCAGVIEVGDQKIRVQRTIYATRDIDGSWTLHAELPGDREGAETGVFRVTAPVGVEVIERLVQVIADPPAFAGPRSTGCIGPNDGPIPVRPKGFIPTIKIENL